MLAMLGDPLRRAELYRILSKLNPFADAWPAPPFRLPLDVVLG